MASYDPVPARRAGHQQFVIKKLKEGRAATMWDKRRGADDNQAFHGKAGAVGYDDDRSFK